LVVYKQSFVEGILGDRYDVVVCESCGAGFADCIPSQFELDAYYAEQSKYSHKATGGADSIYDLRRFESIVDRLEPYLGSRGIRILDIGCATGGLLSVFKKRGFKNILGADPSRACSEAALKTREVVVSVATLREMKAWNERFDLILLAGVLEHLRDLGNAMAIIGGLSKPNGVIYAAVPDVAGLAGCRNAPFQQFSMEHVNFFSLKSLNRVMAAYKFSPQRNWQDVVEWREGVSEPIASGLFRRTTSDSLQFDDLTGPSLNRYVAASQKWEDKICDMIAKLAVSRQPILIWGVGALTRHLMATSRLAEVNIVAFVDSNALYHGKKLLGKTILSPGQIAGRTEPILISSIAFEQEIVSVIQKDLVLSNPLLHLPL
jgi:SAM-dependent methyltransferase